MSIVATPVWWQQGSRRSSLAGSAGRRTEPYVPNPDRLLQLFHAYREQNDPSFRRAAEAIIAEEVIANHHSVASQLQKALGPPRNGRTHALRPLHGPQSRPDDLLHFPQVGTEDLHIVFCRETQSQITRFLEEQRQRLKLAEHGYCPKSRLLFWGPPGCGKTVTARFLAQQLGLPLAVLRLSAAVSYYLGETSSRIQQAFDAAASTPMVLFLDEVDALAKNRDDTNDIGELKRVVNALLQAMDAFDDARSVLVAASNHQYLLDDAAWRRFDAIIPFPLPGPEERSKFIGRMLNGVSLKGSLAPTVRASDRLSFADIEKAIVETVKTMILAGRANIKTSDVTAEIKSMKAATARARHRAQGSDRES